MYNDQFIIITIIMSLHHFLLESLSLLAILSGILVIISRNPVISVLFLISVFVNVAGYLVVLGISFVGISYIIVYVGAISILFLFVVIMLNMQLAEINAVGTEYTQNIPLGIIVGSLFLFELTTVLSYANTNITFYEVCLGTLHWFTSLFIDVNNNNIAEVHQAFNKVEIDSQFSSFLQIQSIGQVLYTSGSLWLIITSVILLLAIVGPIILTIDKR